MVVSLLLLLVMAFSVFVRMEMRRVVSHQHLSQAQANARLGADLAISRLQELTGPDRRITAPGEMLDGTVANLARPGVALPLGKRRWVGVWDTASFAETNPGAKRFLGWLVSAGASGTILGLEDTLPADNVLLLGPASVAQPNDQIRAGKVTWGDGTQALAWMVEDEGLKAQLASANRNDAPTPPPGLGVIPGAVALGRLPGLSSLGNTSSSAAQRLHRLRDLSFFGAAPQVVETHRFDYTTRSLGVLSDAKNGGLKKDLTLAFENDTVFARVFPAGNFSRYLLLDADKLAAASDLRTKGYIHWNIFKDFYNTKRFIHLRDNQPVLDFQTIDKRSLASGTTRLAFGNFAPHDLGGAQDPSHTAQPYGDIIVAPEARGFKHNHVGLILATVQQNAWLEYVPPPTPGDSPQLRTRVQLWTGFYNPYNIALISRGNSSSANNREAGPRLLNYPQVFFHIPEIPEFATAPGLAGMSTGLRELHDVNKLITRPGMTQVYGLQRNVGQGSEINQSTFGPAVKNLVLESVTTTQNLASAPSASLTVNIAFSMMPASTSRAAPNIMHGTDMAPTSADGDMEVNQVLYAPFAWDQVSGYPSKKISRTATPSELTSNNMFSAFFSLRTTRESGNALRPLIDANIRAPWCNPRWDSPLGLSTLAAYTPDNRGEATDPYLPMDTGVSPLGFSYWGAGRDPSYGSTRVILFDIPRSDLVSLGQLQHAGAGRFSYEPTYIVGNSYANPRLPLNDWRASIRDTFSSSRGLTHPISGNFNLYDASYLVNQRLWDGFVFTTLPQQPDNYPSGSETAPTYPALLTRAVFLPNPRFIPYTPQGSVFNATSLKDEGDAAGARGSFHHNAGHVLVDGQFNVNSTSVTAWEAFLSGTLDLPVQGIDSQGRITGFRPVTPGRVRFPRVMSLYGDGMDRDSLDENYWTGFRELRTDEIRALAEEIVRLIKIRGPFLSMGEFVNRMLRNDEHGHAGVLQAALDATLNDNLSSSFERPASASPGTSTQGAGFPGQLLQGDLLQALSPIMSVRSDTFTIRSYGELVGSPGGSTMAKAWCEVVVQRLPDPIRSDESLPLDLTQLATPPSPFGRRYHILSFRWLTEDEI
jgi:hypothetical protein